MSHVILDLDGTLINTEQLVDEVVSAVLHEKGNFSSSQVRKAMELVRGMRPTDGTKEIMKLLDIKAEEYSPEAILGETSALLNARWGEVSMMPGARRLLDHLYAHRHRIKTALATSTPSSFLRKKMASHDGWIERLDVITTGDEVENGKPSPDIFALAMARLNVTDSKLCVVLEDTPLGVRAAKAAGAYVIAIPSIRDDFKAYEVAGADEIIQSLYDFRPEKWGLPKFEDAVTVRLTSVDRTDTDADTRTAHHSVVPLRPVIQLSGRVGRVFGRGSKTLGMPTANLDVGAGSVKRESDALAPGIYFGWAGVRRGNERGDDVGFVENEDVLGASRTKRDADIYPVVMRIEWNPSFENRRKTAEPRFLRDFVGDVHGADLRVSVVGYVRPATNFVSRESFVERMTVDADVTRNALRMEKFARFKRDPYLKFVS